MPNTLQNIPNAGDLLSKSQADLKGNFGYLPGALGKDHQVVFGDSDTGTAFEGRHLQVSLKDRAGNPALPADGEIGILYANGTSLFWRTSLGIEQLTAPTIPSPGGNGYTFLAGNMVLAWGTTNSSGLGTTVVTMPVGSAIATVYSATANSNDFKRAIGILNIAGATFSYQLLNDSGGIPVRWIAIGTR